jgi:WD40 repeat protein
LERLTEEAADDFFPALSPDGSRMVFVSSRSGHQEIWIRDLRTGEDTVLTTDRIEKWKPGFSPDGSKVSFAESPLWNVYIVPVSGGAPEMVCKECGQASDWSSDGKRIIGNTLAGRAWMLDVASGRRTDLLASRRWIAPGNFSPDNRWFILFDDRDGYIARLADVPAAERAWIRIMDGALIDAWSPDGNVLYGTARRDGHLCIWGQRLDPATKLPIGAPFAVFHSHNSRLSLSNQTFGIHLATGRDKMLFYMGERTGNIWMAEWRQR